MICVMKVKMDNHIKSSNFAESFLVVEDLTVTHFLITRTNNILCDKPVLTNFALLFVVLSLLSLDQVTDYVRIPDVFIL